MVGEIAVSNRVIARNGIGRFISECEIGAERTVEKAIERGAELSRTFAPVGHKADPRTTKLKDSIHTRMLGRTAGEWYAAARHALAQEKGARGHLITGSPGLYFWWEAAGRYYVPASVFYHEPGRVTIVNHPGNPARPYLRPAYAVVIHEIMDIARREYPN